MPPVYAAPLTESWLGESAQRVKWSFCLNAARMPRIRRDHDATDETEPHGGLQGEGGVAAVKGDLTLSELAQHFDVHPNQITQWKAQLLEGASGVFDGRPGRSEPAIDLKFLHAKIGELTLENDFLEGALGKAGLLGAKR